MSSDTRYLKLLWLLTLLLNLLAFSEYLLLFDGILLAFSYHYLKQYQALQRVQIKRSLSPERLFENEVFSLKVEWANPSSQTLKLLLQASDRKIGLEQSEVPVQMKARSTGELSQKGSFFHYGKASLGKVRMFCEHPTGLYRLWRNVDLQEDIRIFPRLPELDFYKEALHVPLPGRKTSSRLLEDTSDLLKVRPYERESWNRIHWKLSAKLDQWMVKEYSFTASGAVYLLLDLNRPASIFAREVWSVYRKQYERYAIEAASRLVWSIRSQALPLSLFCVGKQKLHIPLASLDPVHYLEELIGLEGSDHPQQCILEAFKSAAINLQPHDTLILLTMHLDPQHIPQLIALRSQCAKFMALLFPYGFRKEEGQAGEDLLSVHPDARELLNMASELSSHHIHLRFVSSQQTLQEGISAFP